MIKLWYGLLNFENPSVLSLLFCFLPLPMCHFWWTSCPRGYLSGSICIWMQKNVDTIVDGTSPTIKRSQTGMSPDTGMSAPVGVPHIVLRDITKLSYDVSDDNTLWYRNADRFIRIKPCEWRWLTCLEIISLSQMTALSLNAGPRNVIFLLPTILFQVISPNVHFPHIVSRICLVNLIT